MEWILIYFSFILVCYKVHIAEGACTFPSQMQKDFTMIYITPNAVRGDTFSNVTITESSLTGMSVDTLTVINTVWNCQLKDGDNYVTRGTEIGDSVGNDVYLYFGFTFYVCLNDSTNTTSQTFCLIKPLSGMNSDAYDLPIEKLPTSEIVTVSKISSSSVPDNEYYLLVQRTGSSYGIRALMDTFQSIVTKLTEQQKNSTTGMTANYSVLIGIMCFFVLKLTNLYPK